MYKRLRIYYLYTAMPFALLLLGALLYRHAIVKTIASNPHPQINYLIFAIILIGGVLIIRIIHRLMYEAKEIALFRKAQKEQASPAQLQDIAMDCEGDVSYVLRMIAASTGRPIAHQEQVALENEVQKLKERLVTRNALPQFFSGLLVGMGLLGTFIGLLATLDDIATLIASFATLDMKTADPIAIFAEMVNKMEAPMHSMGIAFSASMYGLMGSIILSFMMVSVRRCVSEIHSVLGSEVAQHIELSFASNTHDQANMQGGMAFGGLALRSSHIPDDEDMFPIHGDNSISTTVNINETLQQNDLSTEAMGQDPYAPVSPINSTNLSEDIRILRRIEDRLAESLRIQERGLSLEIDDFQKQRADTLRVISEQTESSNDFKTELQRVGRQIGDLLAISEKNSVEISTNISDMKILMRDSASENQRLLTVLIQQQADLIEALKQQKNKYF
jgi:hypothetical protein